jgi:hypothetical protein
LNGDATRPCAEAALPAGGERLPPVARQQERAGEQQREQRVPAVLVELGDRRDVLEAGVGDDRVEAAECRDRPLDRGAVAVPRLQVGGERLARAVRVGLEVDGEHAGAVGDQRLGDRAADPARRAGHDRLPAHETGPYR